MTKRPILALLGAGALALQPQIAAAQQACIAEEEVSALAIYAVPGLVRSLQLTCARELSQNGFLVREGDALAARYAALQGGVWPSAKAALLRLARSEVDIGAAKSIGMIANLPDDSVRPLVDALIVQEVSSAIQPAECGRIERVLEALAPIEPQVAGALLGVSAGLVDKAKPLVCPVRGVQ